ncbi:hypothetical protein HDU99_002787, partial [Rhizoclosmatium hyalinum]
MDLLVAAVDAVLAHSATDPCPAASANPTTTIDKPRDQRPGDVIGLPDLLGQDTTESVVTSEPFDQSALDLVDISDSVASNTATICPNLWTLTTKEIEAMSIKELELFAQKRHEATKMELVQKHRAMMA